jgi:hypothetical protein
METVGPMAAVTSGMFVVSPFVVVTTLSFRFGGRNRSSIRWARSCCKDHWLPCLVDRGSDWPLCGGLNRALPRGPKATLATISNRTW